MKPQLVLVRILRPPTTPSTQTPPPSLRDPIHHTGTAQWDVNHPFHLAVLESQGILQTYMLETAEGGATALLYPCVAFQLYLSFGVNAYESGNKCGGDTSRKDWNDEFNDGLKPIKQPWGSFEFIPKRPGEIIFFQAESSRILFAQLPGGSPRSLIYPDEETIATQIDQVRTKVFCVGRHSSTILSIAVRPDGLALVSAGRDGCLKIWRLSDGTMIAQTMFARWRQPRNPGIGRVSPLRRQNDEVDCAYPALRVVSFFGKSWDVAMGCPSGEARTWTQEVDAGSSLTIKNIAESATLFSGKCPISSLALHVPDSNVPFQSDENDAEDEEGYSARMASNLQERVAVGTINGKLQVWTRHKNLGDWSPTWSTTPSSEGASIVCLSFRADGGLLAAAASFLAKQLTDEETEALLLASPPKKIKRVCERLYLYETLSWSCVGSLNFSSQIGSCLFYRPTFRAEDKKDPRSCVSQEKVSSCRVLLVATASGPQAHILPEHGLFGYRDRRYRYQRRQQQSSAGFRKEVKTVRWADLKRERREGEGGAHHSPPSPSDHWVRPRSAPADISNTRCNHAARHCGREQLRPVTGKDLLWTTNSPMGRSEARRNLSPAAAAGKSRCGSPKLRSRSRSPAGCVQSLKNPSGRDPYQHSSLLCRPAECVGLPMDVVMKYRAGTRQWPHQVKIRKCVCCSKDARSRELQVPYPMGQVVIQTLKNVAAEQKPSVASRQVPRRRAAIHQAARKPNASCAELADPSPIPSSLVAPRFKRKPRTILSRKFDVDDDDQSPRPEHEDESDSECESQFHDEDCPSFLQHREHQRNRIAPNEPALSRERFAIGDAWERGEEENKHEEGNGGGEEAVREKTLPTSDAAASHPQAAEQQQKHHQPGARCKRLYSEAVNQHFKGGKENFHDPDENSRDSLKHHNLVGTPQYSRSGKDSPVLGQQQSTNINRSQLVGGDNLPRTPQYSRSGNDSPIQCQLQSATINRSQLVGGDNLPGTPQYSRSGNDSPVQCQEQSANINRPQLVGGDNLPGTPQYSRSGIDSPVQCQQEITNINRSQPVGGDNLPAKHIVGGNELEDFLVKEMCPLKVVDPATRDMAKERKLVQPEPFSTAKLMARLHEIEQETFSMEAALRVAKLRGIELNDEDEKDLKKALEQESKETTINKPKERELESEKPSMRYTQLKKIDAPGVSHSGPFLAARKMRKQVDSKWKDTRTMKPALSDLWIVKERCAQVCSSAPADIDHIVMDLGVDRDAEDGELCGQREATSRHAWSSQALYDSCLYKPDQRDSDCGCNMRVHTRR